MLFHDLCVRVSTMNCLSCSSEYEKVEYEGQNLLFCAKCSLFWFTQGQLARIDLISEEFKEFTDALELDEEEQELDAERCSCCDLVLHSRSYTTAPHVKIRECYNCGGMVLNGAQIKEIRENSMTPTQVEAYLNQIKHSVPGFMEIEHGRKNGGGFGKFAKAWQKVRFWDRDK